MKKFIGFFLLVILLIGCDKTDSEVIARVGDKKLTLEELKSFYKDNEWDFTSNEEKRKVVRDWMDLQALANYADEIELTEEKTVRLKIDLAVNKAKVNALLSSEMNKISITEDELFNYYKIHQGEYKSQIDAFKIQRIFVTTDSLLNHVHTLLKNKENFTDIVKEYSEERIADNGGYYGWVHENDDDLTMYECVKNLKPYQYKTVKVRNGYYIVRYYNTKKIDIDVRYESIKSELKEKLLKEKKERVYNELLKSLKNTYDMSLSF